MKTLFGLFLLFLYVLSLPFSPETAQPVPLNYVAEDLQLDISQGEVIKNKDTHGGWLGDGESIVILSFTPEEYAQLEEQLTEHWYLLPLPDTLQGCLSFRGLDDDMKEMEQTPLLTPAKHGYYYFFDRHSDSTNPYDHTDLFSRYSYNFTLAILDSETHTLQYLRYDT